MPHWIDFKQLRQSLSFEAVLRHYNVALKIKGRQHHGFCPLPNHQGKRNSASFSANLDKGIFNCFGCGAHGNVLEFAALKEGIDPKDGAELHKVALKLQERFCPATVTKQKPAPATQKHTEQNEELPVVVNAPLDFTLKELDRNHPYLRGRRFTQQTIDHFGLGFCSRGYHKNRVAIPLCDHTGNLVGYAGRVVDDATITDENPRYLLPGDRKRDGTLFEFRKTLFLYNGYRIKAPLTRLIVVESFTAVWWLVQNNLPDVVGTMGADCSDEQARLVVSLTKPDGQVWALTDGDPAGERCAASILTRVAPHRLVRWVKLDEGKQPTNLSEQELKLRLLL